MDFVGISGGWFFLLLFSHKRQRYYSRHRNSLCLVTDEKTQNNGQYNILCNRRFGQHLSSKNHLVTYYRFHNILLMSNLTVTARKTIFSFSRRPEKVVFPKKSHWNIIFLVLSGNIMFLFPENMVLHFRRKMKDDLSPKIHGILIFSSNFLKIWSFMKGLCQHMIFLVLSGKMAFFSQNMIFLPWAGSEG